MHHPEGIEPLHANLPTGTRVGILASSDTRFNELASMLSIRYSTLELMNDIVHLYWFGPLADTDLTTVELSCEK
jgi:hypothetical protein